MTVDILGVVGFERTIVGLLEQDDNGHHFDFDTSGLGVRAGALLRSVSPAARLAQTAARNRLRSKRVRVYSLVDPPGDRDSCWFSSIIPGAVPLSRTHVRISKFLVIYHSSDTDELFKTFETYHKTINKKVNKALISETSI